MQDAAARAQLYADALDLGTVRAVAIADAGMLGAHAQSQGDDGIGSLHAAPGSAGGGRPDVKLEPKDISVSATVDARFVTVAS